MYYTVFIVFCIHFLEWNRLISKHGTSRNQQSTRICEPRTRCIRSAVRSLGPWASHGGDSAGGATHLGWCRVATDSNLEPTDSEGPMVATGGGGGHWQWDCQHRGWHEEVEFKCCYFWDNPSFLSSWNHLELCKLWKLSMNLFYMVFLEPRKGLKRSDWPSQKPTNSWGRRAGSWCIPSRLSHNFRGSQAVWIF